MPDLLLHTADSTASRNAVEQTPTPPPTYTWRPIPHEKLLTTVEDSLIKRGFYITGEAHGLTHNGNRYFGLLEVRNSDETQDTRTVVGVRNSSDKAFSAGVVLGSCVLVCSNLCFSGEVSLSRKHTRFILRDLPFLVSDAIGTLLDLRTAERQRITRYKQQPISDLLAHDTVIHAVDEGVIAPSRVPKVLQEWRNPSHEEFTQRGKTAWRLFNAFTESWKGSNLQTLPARSSKLQSVIDQACRRPYVAGGFALAA
jgi:hypothetical protein